MTCCRSSVRSGKGAHFQKSVRERLKPRLTCRLFFSCSQASYSDQARSSAFGTFQSLMKMVCKEQASFFSRSDTFMNLPRVDELLEDDKEKFNIPEDSSKKIVILVCLICISMISSALYKCPVCVGRGYILANSFCLHCLNFILLLLMRSSEAAMAGGFARPRPPGAQADSLSCDLVLNSNAPEAPALQGPLAGQRVQAWRSGAPFWSLQNGCLSRGQENCVWPCANLPSMKLTSK